MQTVIKKVYLSILVVVLCAVAFTATTFAWVGIFTTSTFEQFHLNMESSDLDEYSIEISLTGEEGTFGPTVDIIKVKEQILRNFGVNMNYINTDEAIEYAFQGLNMHQCTVKPNDDKTFPDFIDVYNVKTTRYFKFDIYISIVQSYESDSTSDYALDAYLTGSLLEGAINQKNLINKYIYPSDFINNATNGIQANTVIDKNIKINSADACRVAIQKYNVVDKGKPESYETNSQVIDNIIYQSGSVLPTQDPVTGVYSFGGILPDNINLATYDWNMKFRDKFKYVPDWALNRGDIVFDKTKPNQIINSSLESEKITTDKMMKLTIYFWIEGWDADCIDVIDRTPITLSLNFTTEGE